MSINSPSYGRRERSMTADYGNVHHVIRRSVTNTQSTALSSLLKSEIDQYEHLDDLTGHIVDEYTPVETGDAASNPWNPWYKKPAEHVEQAGFWLSTFNLWNDVLANNVVAVPFFFYQMGFWFGPTVFILMGILTWYTLNICYYLGKKYQQDSFPELCQYALGKTGYIAMCFFIFVFNYGGFVGALIIVGANIPTVLQEFFHSDSVYITRPYILMYICLLMFPLAFFKNLSSFAFNSFFSLFSIMILVVCVALKAIRDPEDRKLSNDHIHFFGCNLISPLGGVSFLYICHDMSFNVAQELKNPTASRWNRLIGVTMCLSLVPWLVTGFAGYLMFGYDVNPNILINFQDDIPATIARIALSLNILISVPYFVFMPRVSIYAVLSLVFKMDHTTFHLICTTCVVISAFLIAVFVTNLGVIAEITGSLGASGIGYIMPPLCFLRLEKGAWYSPMKIINFFILCYGLFILIMSTVITFNGFGLCQ